MSPNDKRLQDSLQNPLLLSFISKTQLTMLRIDPQLHLSETDLIA